MCKAVWGRVGKIDLIATNTAALLDSCPLLKAFLSGSITHSVCVCLIFTLISLSTQPSGLWSSVPCALRETRSPSIVQVFYLLGRVIESLAVLIHAHPPA